MGNARRAVAAAAAGAASAVLLAVFSPAARADGPPASAPATAAPAPAPAKKKKVAPLVSFEEAIVARALERRGVKIDPAPDGKIISTIVFEREDVIGPTDFAVGPLAKVAPLFNHLHTISRESTVERELLFKRGDRYRRGDVAESERRLRDFIIFAAARIVPFQVTEPGHVGVLVVTKDLWSLRTNFYVIYNAGALEYFETNPSENNLFGIGQTLWAHIQFDLGKFTFGEGFYDPRLFGSRISALEEVRVRFERYTGKPEGWLARLLVRPAVVTLHTPLDWFTELRADRRVDRVFQGRHYLVFGEDDFGVGLPVLYHRDIVRARAGVTRAFGYAVRHKVDLVAGYLLDHSRLPDYFPVPTRHLGECNDCILRAYPDDLIGAFESEVLPVSGESLFVSLAYRVSESRFTSFKNFGALGTTEDFQVGPFLGVQLDFGGTLDGTPDYVQGTFKIGWDERLGNDLLQVGFVIRTRLDSRDGPFEGRMPRFVHNAVDLVLRNASPPILWGRVHTRLVFGIRDRDLDRTRFCVGGGYPAESTPVVGHGDLRGFVTNRFCGTHRVLANFEYRTMPLNLYSVQVGAALFVDAAMLWGGEGFEGTNPVAASVGLGLRAQFPQLDREAFRFDFAVPILGRDPSVDHAFAFALLFLQVF